MEPLYSHPELYRAVFRADAEEDRFFREILARARPGWLVDLGCGESALAARVWGPERAVGFDRSPEMLRHLGRRMPACRADILALPLLDGAASAMISRLFGVSYALAEQPSNAGMMMREFKRVLSPEGILAIELPISHYPNRVAGLSENASIDGGISYEFQYLDVVEEVDYGFILNTRIQVGRNAREYELCAPLYVFTPAGVGEWFAAEGFGSPVFHAPYDVETKTEEPPDDVLRAVAVTAAPPSHRSF